MVPTSLKTALVEIVKNQIIGFKTAAKKEIMPQTEFASFSLCFIAIRFGTSSPKIRVKYDKIRVTSTTATVLIILVLLLVFLFFSFNMPVLGYVEIAADKTSAKLSAAKAEPRKPARVIPI